MTPHYADDWLTLYGGDCREVLRQLPSDSVDCVVTSPPYWGLRDYGTATWEGGDGECDHKPPTSRRGVERRSSTLGGGVAHLTAQEAGQHASEQCPRCGAIRIDSQLGLERTPEEYVANMVAVFREVRRVLKPSGTCWLNLGDSYIAPRGNTAEKPGFDNKAADGHAALNYTGTKPSGHLKVKDLAGIPWRVAFALQADGWYLRSDIIWSKPNPMPESVTDRPTKSHEYLFLLTKSARYYFDADAVREAAIYEGTVVKASNPETAKNGQKGKHGATAFGFTQHDTVVAGRNIRSVWTIATRPYPGAHFAVFPPELPERCIKAGSPTAGKRCDCDEVILTPLGEGASDDPTMLTGRKGMNRTRRDDEGVRPITRREQRDYARQIATSPHKDAMAAEAGDAFAHYTRTDSSGARPVPPALLAEWKARGWLAEPESCQHPIEGPGVILDPFGGSGTVGMVANRLSRRAILIDLNPEYLKQQMTRNSQVPLGLTEGDAA